MGPPRPLRCPWRMSLVGRHRDGPLASPLHLPLSPRGTTNSLSSPCLPLSNKSQAKNQQRGWQYSAKYHTLENKNQVNKTKWGVFGYISLLCERGPSGLTLFGCDVCFLCKCNWEKPGSTQRNEKMAKRYMYQEFFLLFVYLIKKKKRHLSRDSRAVPHTGRSLEAAIAPSCTRAGQALKLRWQETKSDLQVLQVHRLQNCPWWRFLTPF